VKALQLGGKLTCGTTDCANDLHCYNRSQKATRARKGKPFGDAGVCGACGEDPGIAWDRLHRCDPADTGEKLALMRQEYIREYFWTHPFTEKVMNHALRSDRSAASTPRPRRSPVARCSRALASGSVGGRAGERPAGQRVRGACAESHRL
jgi:hypothetical protein